MAIYNIELLNKLKSVLEGISDEAYTAVGEPYYASTIGAHVRHIVDHYILFLAGVGDRHIDYDRRPHAIEIENSRPLALEKIDVLVASLQQFSQAGSDQMACEVTIDLALSVHRDTPTQHSTLGRELSFLYSHTTHHHSLIASILRIMEIAVPADMGVAPSTLKRRL